jgi:hypothetical protein
VYAFANRVNRSAASTLSHHWPCAATFPAYRRNIFARDGTIATHHRTIPARHDTKFIHHGIIPARHATIQPQINVEISGSHVNVDWGWQGNAAYLDICEIQVDRGDGKGYVLLAYDTTPGYTDTQPFSATRPSNGHTKPSTAWATHRPGNGSNPVSITVGG